MHVQVHPNAWNRILSATHFPRTVCRVNLVNFPVLLLLVDAVCQLPSVHVLPKPVRRGVPAAMETIKEVLKGVEFNSDDSIIIADVLPNKQLELVVHAAFIKCSIHNRTNQNCKKWHLTSRHLTTNRITSSLPATDHIKTGHHITTMERLKARSLKKLGLGIAVVGHPVHIL